MPSITWLAAGLLLTLPAEYPLLSQELSTVETPIPGESVQELTCLWQRDAGHSLRLSWWNAASPPRPGGPMAAAEEWQVPLHGETVRVARTRLFMGRADEVLVAWLPAPDGRSYALLVGRGWARPDFDRVLAALQRQAAVAPPYRCIPQPSPAAGR